MPWVLGFAHAHAVYPDWMDEAGAEAHEPLALVFQHLDAQDLEDADELVMEMQALEPPQHLAEAVEQLVRAVMLLADLTRPQASLPPAM